MRNKSDEELEKDVKEKLLFEPQIDESRINLSLKNGVVSLFGVVGSYLEKRSVERAVKSVDGVKAVANDLIVDITAQYRRTDTEIANAAVSALKWNVAAPEESIKVIVEDGCVTLTGSVDWWYQRHSAEKAVRNLIGVKSVNNLIAIHPVVTSKDIKKSIMEEFHRNATIDAGKINVEVDGGKVILNGKLQSWAEIKEAKRAVWSVPGVTQVQDQLSIA